MKASALSVAHRWQGRAVDLSDHRGPASWRAAQALALEGATVYIGDSRARDRAHGFDRLARERGLEKLALQWAAELRGEISSDACAPHAEKIALHEAEEPSENGENPAGVVTLVGGGPGDPSLLTVAALTAIARADVVLLDRLGIALNVVDFAPAALVIDVGKAPGRHKMSQDSINETMLAFARAGARVVRLKGGDPFIFGRGGEEWRFLAEQGIRVDVVPGLTSALSVPAHAGVSATYREVTRAVTIMSGHQPFNQAELSSLVSLGSTIVILMGVATFPSTVAGLRKAGLPDSTGVALLEQGYTANERHTFTTLGAAIDEARARGVTNPAVIVIGDVVNVREASAEIIEARTDTPTEGEELA
ncbi:uroporphyrinogen-III C-methyltransferase [Dermabacter vaginalis]|uniref:uroporphyrinogen-III C-methyltransferase n=1 Tax=Dermabacter TaxID=36739 RepID=UPI002024D81B|nr:MULTISPECIES: uroporphyrinogen-III C-methyltransferase [Dermabacter]MCT2150130.1 uroporphyrinogen-III C-methyltransferase [Dermabacter vaginalis]